MSNKPNPSTTKPVRDRPARNPGGCECQRCMAIFIGEEWHQFCGVCVAEVASEIAEVQGNG